jgi:hypothetical protein
MVHPLGEGGGLHRPPEVEPLADVAAEGAQF